MFYSYLCRILLKTERDQVLLSGMEHRHISNQLLIPGYQQHGNNRHHGEQSRIPMVMGVATESVHFVTPMDRSVIGGAHSNSGWDLVVRSNEYHSSNVSMETQHLPPPFSRPLFDPYTPTSTNGSTSLAPVGPVGHIHSTHGLSESRGPHKRTFPGVFEGSSDSFNGAGSSSSSQMLIQEPAVERLNQPLYRGSNLSINGQDLMRNVRRRSEPELEPFMTRAHVPNYASQCYHPTTPPSNYPVPVHPINLSAADVTGRELNIAPHAASYTGRTSHPDINDPRRESNQFYIGGSSVDINASHHIPFIRGNLASSSQDPHVAHVQPTSEGHNYHYQRVTPFYRNGPNGGSSSTNELQLAPESLSSRYSRYSAAIGWAGVGYRTRRPRMAVGRLQPPVDVMDSGAGFGHETVTVEQSSSYREPRNFPDMHQDMRLDIESMGYEELLALEERIGILLKTERDQVLLSGMEHRHISNQLLIPGYQQHGNNRHHGEQSRIPMVMGVATESVHFVTPMDRSVIGGAHSNSGWDLGVRSNEYNSSNVSMETQHLPPPFSRPLFDPYTPTSTNGSTSLAPVGPVGHIHSTHGLSESRGPHKRTFPGVFEGSSDSFHGAGSSSSSQMLIQEPAVERLNQPLYRGSNLSINGQDLMRNVRRRSEPELEPFMTRAHVPNYASQCYHPTTPPSNYPVPVHPINLSAADVTGRELNIAPHAASYTGRTSHPDINDPGRESNQFYIGGSSVDINASHHIPFIRGNLASSSQDPHVAHVQPTSEGHNYHYQRVTPFYRNGPNGGSSSTNELQLAPESLSSRYSRYSAAIGWAGVGYRTRRPRMAVGRLQPPVDVMDSGAGFGHETVTVEQSSSYREPRNFPDMHQDMRLDIESMGYEELLALEERIGYVRSGLSKDEMFKCLSEEIYDDAMDQNHDRCTICLDEYKNGEKIERMKKCGHKYHGDCIKKWMVMKKVCPICRSEC
ncbi:hypothetical protein SSX86_017985 [Deinandra increscens subsp. villosa]|uniref:RING-type E3 ubiquitin transferase n=1 Tax=Deinandra increscens subsp. villosa TaxID=3103831 RepID=A0AAP0D0I9_9ASTR